MRQWRARGRFVRDQGNQAVVDCITPEHWPVGAIASQFGAHPDVVRRVLGIGVPRSPDRERVRMADPNRDFIGK